MTLNDLISVGSFYWLNVSVWPDEEKPLKPLAHFTIQSMHEPPADGKYVSKLHRQAVKDQKANKKLYGNCPIKKMYQFDGSANIYVDCLPAPTKGGDK